MPENDWTEKQDQYLAFITNYSVIHGVPPAEADMQRFFRVTPPTVHQMVLKLEELEFIGREPEGGSNAPWLPDWGIKTEPERK